MLPPEPIEVNSLRIVHKEFGVPSGTLLSGEHEGMKMTTVHPALSYELYPPRSHASCESLLKTITELEQTNPDYVSVTYSGAAHRPNR